MRLSTWMFAAFLLIAAEGADGRTNCYGTIDDLNPTGKGNDASCHRWNAERGVEGSKSDVTVNILHLEKYKECVQEVGEELCIEPALIAGIISRETQGGILLDSRGYGQSDPNGYGLMQCDVVENRDTDLDCTRYGAKSCDHIRRMTKFLIEKKIEEVQRKKTSWTKAQQLQGGVAYYNGFNYSLSFNDVDAVTTCHDYSNDVIARAQYLKSEYGF